MKKISLVLVVVLTCVITAHQASAESWFSKTFGPNGTAFKMLGASVMNITTVDSVQKKLIETGTFAGPVTGTVDAQTVEAVKTFQAANNLKVDGVVGRETLKVLDPAALGGASSNAQPVPVDKWKALCANIQGQTPQPYIEVISPNGGETYTAGQQITVKWKSCNLSTSTNLQILLEEMNPNGTGQGYGLVANGTINDGTQDVNLFSAAQWSQVSGGAQMQFGMKYRVKIMVTNNPGIVDISNNLFTINGSQPSNGTCNSNLPVKLIITGVDSNGGKGDPVAQGSQKHALSRLVLYPTCDLLVDKLNVYTKDYFAAQGFSNFYIHKGYGTNMNGAATGQVLGSVSTVNPAGPLGGTISLNPPLQLTANVPQAVTISGDVKTGNISSNTFQTCLMGPENNLKDSSGNLISQLPGNVIPTTILGRMTCGQYMQIQ